MRTPLGLSYRISSRFWPLGFWEAWSMERGVRRARSGASRRLSRKWPGQYPSSDWGNSGGPALRCSRVSPSPLPPRDGVAHTAEASLRRKSCFRASVRRMSALPSACEHLCSQGEQLPLLQHCLSKTQQHLWSAFCFLKFFKCLLSIYESGNHFCPLVVVIKFCSKISLCWF